MREEADVRSVSMRASPVCKPVCLCEAARHHQHGRLAKPEQRKHSETENFSVSSVRSQGWRFSRGERSELAAAAKSGLPVLCLDLSELSAEF